jgi:hypothetical protein
LIVALTAWRCAGMKSLAGTNTGFTTLGTTLTSDL